jgi:hypothetical protein
VDWCWRQPAEPVFGDDATMVVTEKQRLGAHVGGPLDDSKPRTELAAQYIGSYLQFEVDIECDMDPRI